MAVTFTNPILPGFNPDPSICRVGEDYYIATSTFEWYPGVQIHHSTDLVNWRLVRRPLERPAQLDMRGNPDSCGIWAPCLSHSQGRFWLIYTDMKRYEGHFKDGLNYLVSSPSIEGPWSDPVFLNASGFDPSLFHDDDGRHWLLNLKWDYRQAAGPDRFGGIVLQEYDAEARTLIGPIHTIFAGTAMKLTEGPHLYRRDGWYHLLVAEGGTGYGHAVTMARSRSITGPYEVHPDNPVLTSRDDESLALQRAGHADLVDTPAGETYLVHLCGRPLPGTQRSPLGRETALQRAHWDDDGWLRLAVGGNAPQNEVEAPYGATSWPLEREESHAFDSATLPMAFQWLRTPYPERLFSLTERRGYLRLYGRQSPGSWFEQALVARRRDVFSCEAETTLEFAPEDYQQCAGLIAYYNRFKFHYLAVTRDDAGRRVLTILSCADNWPSGDLDFPLAAPVMLDEETSVRLGLTMDGASLQFRYAEGGGEWQPVGPTLDAGVLSDEGAGRAHGYFTGTFLGMAAHDISGRALPADFSAFRYIRSEPRMTDNDLPRG
ncbi:MULTISPECIES: glycoside hydrolase family 43 protein [unclassified Modicisalibacter]|uniref:glycoside hydrolase family 43 protein n=1 Tax=unclassified Modicisalibacter TaxID=2679913 RepID=UPI001CCE4FB4|nr:MULTISPECIES: glycoside hydrolase family 43 protein [unclassified Modicisalibacter]MBZ9560247.1 glycoside hydrolase family 43 protein [Modicisalibacter sp. R2A 31.J]MBZ9576156.1 glycoside hydrolase family 43 protein [Modicisalibacter sp. MOD 31.J]